jgi:hypothetical protein
MRMYLAMTGIDHQPLIVRLANEYFQQGFPLPFVTPATKAPVGVLPVAVVWRQVSPRGARAQYPENSIKKPSVIVGNAAPSAFAPRQMRLK